MNTILALIAVLVVGDFASTFFYHVPQHVWFKLHLRTHHDRRLSYWDQAVISRRPEILLDGFLGAFPYFVVATICGITLSAPGALLGLGIGWTHVWWRHTTVIGWRSPGWLVATARVLQLVLPEDHAEHHRDPEIEFGDLFRFYDAPARACIAWLRRSGLGRRSLAVRPKT